MKRWDSTGTASKLATLVMVTSLLLGVSGVSATENTALHTPSPATAEEQPAAVAHASTRDVAIDQGGTQVALLLTDMPDDAVVAGVHLKVSVAGVPAVGLQVQVAAPDGARMDIPLQAVAAVEGSDGKAAPDEMQVAVARTADTFHALDGRPALGAWTVTLVPVDGSLVGRAAGVSLVVQYTTSYAWPLQSAGSGGRPAMHSLQAPIWELSAPATPDRDEKTTLPADASSPDAWQVIKTETFEGAFPNTGWTVVDQSNDGYERFWDDDDYKPYAGSWSAWPANGGANGLDPQLYFYPNNMDTWMIYGPFNLSDAVDARTVFRLWREIEVNYDYVFFGVSANGASFTGLSWDGYQGWTEITRSYSSFVGDSTVWVGWKFYSDSSVVDDGPFVDNISIEKDVSACGPYADAGGWEIPDDGSWLVVPLADRTAPRLGTVAEVNVKYLLNHPDPGQLEVVLAKEGSAVEQVLASRGAAMAGAELGTALGLTAFTGAPAPGEWQLRVRDLAPGGEGRLAAASVRARYTPIGPTPTVVAGPPGQVSALSLPADAQRVTAPDDERPAAGAPTGAARQPEGWANIMAEGFEGIFPYTGWTLLDLSNDGCDFLWDDDDFKPRVGSWAAWPAAGGADGLDPAVSNYPPNMNSWMIYGPFSLTGATNADALFSLWRQIEPAFDRIAFGVSHDGTNFNTIQWDGTANWTDIQVNFLSFVGDGSVWVAWIFQSDSTVQYDGPWIDEIRIRRYNPPQGPYFPIIMINR